MPQNSCKNEKTAASSGLGLAAGKPRAKMPHEITFAFLAM